MSVAKYRGELSPQKVPAAHQARLHCAFRDPKDLGDLVIRHFVELAENEHRTVGERQGCHCSLHQLLALGQFQRTDGFKVGVDGSIAVIAIGAGGAIDTNSITKPVIGFIFDEKGLMYNLTLEGSTISRISR